MKAAIIANSDALVTLGECQTQDAQIFADFLARVNCLNSSVYSLGQYLITLNPDDKRLFTITTNIHKTKAVDDA